MPSEWGDCGGGDRLRLLSDGRRGTGARILEASDGIELEGVGSLPGV